MHYEYMGALRRLGMALDHFEQYAHKFAHLPTYWVRHRARELIQFDRDILLAQRNADMAAFILTNNHGDLKPMSNAPKYIRLDGQVYIHVPNRAACCVTVVREKDAHKPAARPVKQIDATELLDSIMGKLTETSLAQELIAQGTVQNISIASAARKSIDDMASEAYQQQGHTLCNEAAEVRWTAAYRIAHLRIRLGDAEEECGDSIQSEGYGIPGKPGWKLSKRSGSVEFKDEWGVTRFKSNPCE